MKQPFLLAPAFALLVAACATCPPCTPCPAAPPAAAPPVTALPSPPSAPEGEDLMICGQRVPTGTRVVLWSEPPHYDAYALGPRFAARANDPKAAEPRYRPGRGAKRPLPTASENALPAPAPDVEPGCDDPQRLVAAVDQLVLHFDACGLSRVCFGVLQDERHLSAHFLLDVDGTIYQTLDVRETAWHATKANSRSIGVEIANPGAYPPGSSAKLDAWYAHDALGPFLRVPASITESGVRRSGFLARPARAGLVTGRVQGDELVQYDYTLEQYEALVRLAAALCRELPRIRPDAPRDAGGRVRDVALSDEEWAGFQGILGHFHIQTNKRDPGPAFDWERFLRAVRSRLPASR